MPERPAPSSPIVREIKRILETGSVAVLATLIKAPANVGAKLLCGEDTTITGSMGDAKLDQAVARQASLFLKSREDARSFTVSEFAPDLLQFDQALVLFERLQSEPHLVICGAGHVGAALARLASLIGYRTTLIDDRPEFVSRAQFPDERITLLPTNDWTVAVQTAVGSGRGVSVAVVTRGHNEDEQCVRALIDTTPDYIGLIGSKRRTTIVLERLKEAGASETFRNRIRAPIGLDIGAVSPEEVALSILAEVVGDRRGGTGGSLSAFRRREMKNEK